MATFKIDWVEKRTSAAGKDYCKVSLTNEANRQYQGVSVFKNLGQITSGASVTGELKESEYNGQPSYILETGNLGPRPASFPSKIEKMMDKKAENIAVAQGRKEDSISYFNSLNAAIALCKDMTATMNSEDVKSQIKYWREWFLEEYNAYKIGF